MSFATKFREVSGGSGGVAGTAPNDVSGSLTWHGSSSMSRSGSGASGAGSISTGATNQRLEVVATAWPSTYWGMTVMNAAPDVWDFSGSGTFYGCNIGASAITVQKLVSGAYTVLGTITLSPSPTYPMTVALDCTTAGTVLCEATDSASHTYSASYSDSGVTAGNYVGTYVLGSNVTRIEGLELVSATTINCSVGSISSGAASASIGLTVNGTVGNASASGATAGLLTTVNGTVGNASASGATAGLLTTVNGTAGNATAGGSQASVTLMTTIAAGIGGVQTGGATATIVGSSGTTIAAGIGGVQTGGATATIVGSSGTAGAASSGVPRWSARIRGRSVFGSKEEVYKALRDAAQEDAEEAAEEVADKGQREIKRQSRVEARLSLERVVAPAEEIAPLDWDAIKAGINKEYLVHFERIMIAAAKQIAAEDAEDMDDLASVMDYL